MKPSNNKAESQNNESPIAILPLEMLAYILSFLTIRETLKVKTVCKLWYHASGLSLGVNDMALCIEEKPGTAGQPCTKVCHSTGAQHGNSVPVSALKLVAQRRRFFRDIPKLTVFHLRTKGPRLLISKFVLTTPVGQHLQCLELSILEFPVSLPSLKHFKAGCVNLASFESVINNSRRLTELRVDLRRNCKITIDYFNALLRLPIGLKFCKITGRSCDFLAVISSEAMLTLETLKFEFVPGSKSEVSDIVPGDRRVSPKIPLKLQALSCDVHFGMNMDEPTSHIIKRFMKTCRGLEQVRLSFPFTSFLSPEEVFVGLKTLKKVEIQSLYHGNCDTILKQICDSCSESLEELQLSWNKITSDTLLSIVNAKRLKVFRFFSYGVCVSIFLPSTHLLVP